MSPVLIAKYKTHMPQKTLLASNFREMRELAKADNLADNEEEIDTGSQ